MQVQDKGWKKNEELSTTTEIQRNNLQHKRIIQWMRMTIFIKYMEIPSILSTGRTNKRSLTASLYYFKHTKDMFPYGM